MKSVRMYLWLGCMPLCLLCCSNNSEKTVTTAVAGNVEWTSTGLDVKTGTEYVYSAVGAVWPCTEGSVYCKGYDADGIPDGTSAKLDSGNINSYPVPDAQIGCMVGKIGSSAPFALGKAGTLKPTASGLLYLGVNDRPVANNSGSWEVTIRYTKTELSP